MKNQEGFSAVAVVLALILLSAVGFAGWRIYKTTAQNQRETPTNNQRTSAYVFEPVKLDTSKWLGYEPFQGFTLKYPSDWNVKDTGEFDTTQMRTSGLISDTSTVSVTSKATYFFSKDLEITADENGYRQAKETGEVSKGSRISLNIRSRGADKTDPSAEKTCSAYPHQQTEILNFNTYKVCQVQIANDNKTEVYGYDLITGTSKVSYYLAISFNPKSTSEEKNYFVSVAREVVASYKLY
ncbi:MAG: hypothetical protein V4702_00390 [Patescibacteria group bacterium]